MQATIHPISVTVVGSQLITKQRDWRGNVHQGIISLDSLMRQARGQRVERKEGYFKFQAGRAIYHLEPHVMLLMVLAKLAPAATARNKQRHTSMQPTRLISEAVVNGTLFRLTHRTDANGRVLDASKPKEEGVVATPVVAEEVAKTKQVRKPRKTAAAK